MPTILLAVGRDHSSDAARDAAIALARDLGATLEVLTVANYLYDRDPRPFEEVAADAAAAADAEGVEAQPEVRYGVVAHEIANRARDLGAAYVVVGAHRRGRIGTLLHG